MDEMGEGEKREREREKPRWFIIIPVFFFLCSSLFSRKNKIVGPFMGPIAKKGQATRTC